MDFDCRFRRLAVGAPVREAGAQDNVTWNRGVVAIILRGSDCMVGGGTVISIKKKGNGASPQGPYDLKLDDGSRYCGVAVLHHDPDTSGRSWSHASG